MIEDILKEFTPYRVGDKFLYDEEDVRRMLNKIMQVMNKYNYHHYPEFYDMAKFPVKNKPYEIREGHDYYDLKHILYNKKPE